MTDKKSNIHQLNISGANSGPVQIDASEVDFLQCECGSQVFENGVRLGKLPATHPKNTSGRVMIVPDGPYFCCKNCGKLVTRSQYTDI